MFKWLPLLKEKTGVTVLGYSFSEAQTGKSSADRGAAYIKHRIRKYVNSGHNVTNANEMLTAIKGEAGDAKGISFFVCTMNPFTKISANIANITNYKHFAYESNNVLRLWKFHGIGEGRHVSNFTPAQNLPSLTAKDEFIAPNPFPSVQDHEALLEQAEDEANDLEEELDGGEIDEGSLMCSKCGRRYLSKKSFEKHCAACEVQTTRTLEDFTKLYYKRTIDSMLTDDTQQLDTAEQETNEQPENSLSEGWALKAPRKRVFISAKVKSYLKELYDQGNQSSVHKVTPERAAKLMREAKNDDGTPKFTAEDYLSPSQIQGQFYQLKRKFQYYKYMF